VANTGIMTLSCNYCSVRLKVEGPTPFMRAALRAAEERHHDECGGPGIIGAEYVPGDHPEANPHDRKKSAP